MVKIYKCKHFDIKELVSPIVYDRFGEFSWTFLDEPVLRNLDTIRELLGEPITINNWSWGGNYRESGLRSNMDSLVASKSIPYLSGHVLGKAYDLKGINDKKTQDIYYLILDQQERLQAIKRMENIKITNINGKSYWCHIDGLNTNQYDIEIFS